MPILFHDLKEDFALEQYMLLLSKQILHGSSWREEVVSGHGNREEIKHWLPKSKPCDT